MVGGHWAPAGSGGRSGSASVWVAVASNTRATCPAVRRPRLQTRAASRGRRLPAPPPAPGSPRRPPPSGPAPARRAPRASPRAHPVADPDQPLPAPVLLLDRAYPDGRVPVARHLQVPVGPAGVDRPPPPVFGQVRDRLDSTTRSGPATPRSSNRPSGVPVRGSRSTGPSTGSGSPLPGAGKSNSQVLYRRHDRTSGWA